MQKFRDDVRDEKRREQRRSGSFTRTRISAPMTKRTRF